MIKDIKIFLPNIEDVLQFRVNFGIADTSKPKTNMETLLSHADIALYNSKKQLKKLHHNLY